MVYWVIAKLATPASPGRMQTATVERLGPFENSSAASKAREMVMTRYRDRPGAQVEIKCDFS